MKLPSVILCASLLCSCIQTGVIAPTVTTKHPAPTQAALPPPAAQSAQSPDYRQPGPAPVTVTDGTLKIDAGRPLRYSIFHPTHRRAEVLIVLGHGFMRDKARMAGLARHIASWGLDVATPDFRHSRLWAGHHDQNAADMVALARHLKAKRVIYAGFSAGGLSALLAAASDPAAIGYLGMDTVDDGSGAKAAASLAFPLWALTSSPSSCNAMGNGLKAYAAAKHTPRVLCVNDATHCHFEFPMDPLCAVLCGKGEQNHARQEIQSCILGLATSSVLCQAGLDKDARSWWAGNANISVTAVKVR